MRRCSPAVEIYLQSLRSDMDFYIELVDEPHRGMVRRVIDAALAYSRAWFAKSGAPSAQ